MSKNHRVPFHLTDGGKIALLSALILLLICGAVKLSDIISDDMLRADALSTSGTWSASLAETVDDLPAIIAGATPSAESKHLLRAVSEVGDIYRYRVWDKIGHLAFTSERTPSVEAPLTLAQILGNQKTVSLLSGKSFAETRVGEGAGNPKYYAVAYVPLRQNGIRLGVLEIYLDQTADYALYERSFLLTECIIALAILLAGGIPAYMVYRKMLDHRVAKAEALFLAEHDDLTGIPNRRRLEESAIAALSQARRTGNHVAALLVDMHRFKDINDNFGHGTGDGVLRIFAQRLKHAVRTEDLVARLGGDEFVVLQVGLAQPVGSAALAERLMTVLSEPYHVDGFDVSCGATIGIAISPTDADEWDALLTCADAAMYKAKTEGRNAVCFFETGMDSLLRERRRIEADVKRALATHAFQLAYQPILGCRDNCLVGFEALVRWPDGWPPQSPATFIPIAEESGLMVRLGTWVLETACGEAAGWERPLKIAVNLSPVQFRHGDVVAIVANALQVSGLEPARLELEVTESLWLESSDDVLDQLTRLRGMGISIALDDFGTGYSSLTYLCRFPFDKVKIDQSFVHDMERGSKAAAIVHTVLSLARTLHLTVTAEGVETRAQADALVIAGCDRVQGYLFGRPLSASETNILINAEPAPYVKRASLASGQVAEGKGAPPDTAGFEGLDVRGRRSA